jgi:CRP-like cAMP-binding protein
VPTKKQGLQQPDEGTARGCEPDTVNEDKKISNLILKSLPKNEYEMIFPHLEFVPMEWHHSLHEPNVPIRFGYFPDGGIVSLVVPVSDGRSAEVGMVGRDGFVGVPLAGGLDRSPHKALVQVASTASRLRRDVLRKLLPEAPYLTSSIMRFALLQGMQLAQTAACNRLHDLEQRLARWLLMSQDRLNCSVLPYTQELLATMLGTDRPSVTLAVGRLQRNRSIKQGHGEIEILDREKLLASSCECYSVIQQFSGEIYSNHG